jgi:ATP-dependent Lhr-like helicase
MELMLSSLFHAVVWEWFTQRFKEPTEPQRAGWPSIAQGRHTLIAAPTGSGKTLTAFLVCIDRLVRDWIAGRLDDHIRVVYVSPLKALGNDIERNLQIPLTEICELFERRGAIPEIRTAVRTGDTTAADRQAMLRRPPHILVTTPESLYLMLTSERTRKLLGEVQTVVIDEIHALARDKRGSHLSLSLARLDALGKRPPVRIGLSATQRPIDEMARFLVGTHNVNGEGIADCEIVDVGHVRELDLAVEVPTTPLEAVCSNEQWGEIYNRLSELINSHRSTLIFVNTRRLAERVAHQLTDMLGEEAVASHHGSLSRHLRLSAEQRLKAGSLKAIVATASLEMGIDIGFIDLVCQIGSPRSIATFVQRIGRSGHSLGAIPRGRLFPLTRDELLECLALIRAVRAQKLDSIEIPVAPLDILAQQIIASVSAEEWDEEQLFAVCRNAWPYRNIKREDFDAVVRMLSDGLAPGVRRGRHLHRDAIHGRLRARRGARLAALTSGGAIPETAQYRVVTDPDRTYVGQLDEDFAIESMAGDVFLLGNTSWQIRQVTNGEVLVRDAHGAPPTIPFWLGEAPGRTVELSAELSSLRQDLANCLADDRPQMPVSAWLKSECGASDWASEQAATYVAAQVAALGLVPTQQRVVFERFFDESGGMQLVIHSPWGARINRAWGLSLRKRFCRSFDFELQAAATDNGIVLSIGPQHSFPIDSLFRIVNPDNGRYLLEQAVLAVPMFQVRWRWNVGRSLIVLRQNGGKKVPPYLQRFQSDDLLAAVFPETVGCLENHSGDVQIPNQALVRQTMDDCLHEAMDVDRWISMLDDVRTGKVELVARETREPSPFSHELINANPYAFLDGAALEERRTRAVTTRRGLSTEQLQDLGQLSPEAIQRVTDESAPIVRDADELHDTLLSLVAITEPEASRWSTWMEQLVSTGRAASVTRGGLPPVWIAAECWPAIRAIWHDARSTPTVHLPDSLNQTWDAARAVVELIRGRMLVAGPTTADELSSQLGVRVSLVEAALEALEGDGTVLRGRFRNGGYLNGNPDKTLEWCDRRLLARIHRLTLDELRRQIEPVSPEHFLQFLLHHQHAFAGKHFGGPAAVREVIQQLQGLDLPAGAWENHVLFTRLMEYDPQWLDQLFFSGELVWGRIQPARISARENRRLAAALTRNIPISLVLRDDLPWLLPPDRSTEYESLSSNCRTVIDCLRSRGALFRQELRSATQLLDGHIEEALRQLSALGIVTADSFGAVRLFVDKSSKGRRRQRTNRALPSVGRWSCFPGPTEKPGQSEYLGKWCQQLLRRWGVVFRDLLAREGAAPPWHELVPVFRSLERRGEIRGGRFIANVAGEQFATTNAVTELRRVRDSDQVTPWVVITGADPLNLFGIITRDENRLPSMLSNSLAILGGKYIATMVSGTVTFHESTDQATTVAITRSLRAGRKIAADSSSVARFAV